MDWIALALASAAAAILGWLYPSLRSRVRAARDAGRYAAAAKALEAEPLTPRELADGLGFVPTLCSVFGPRTELGHAFACRAGAAETLYLVEVRFGRGGMPWSYRRRLPVVAFELRRTLPMFTLAHPRAGRTAESRVTAFEARGQKLAVEALNGGLELWSREHEREKARAVVGEAAFLQALADDPGWNLRGIDRWLVLFNESPAYAEAADLVPLVERARALRGLLGGRGAPG